MPFVLHLHRQLCRHRGGVAAVLVGAILTLTVLAAAPSWHEHLHHNAHDHDHHCAITLFAGGVDPVASPPVALQPVWDETGAALTAFSSAKPLIKPQRLPASRAPPARA